jgi:phage terminase small subunit
MQEKEVFKFKVKNLRGQDSFSIPTHRKYREIASIPMNSKQHRFCQEYLVDLNGTQAAIRAGYSARTASSIAEENLRKPELMTEIQRLQTERSQRLEITADQVLEDLAAIAFRPITDVLTIKAGKVTLLDSSQWSDDANKAVESVRQSKDGFSIKMVNKLAALEKLGHHLGLFSDLNIALNILRTYGEVTQTKDGYRVKLFEAMENPQHA